MRNWWLNLPRAITGSRDGTRRNPRASAVTSPLQQRIFWVLVSYLALVFLMGGASRYDVQSLIILRPLAVLVGGFALFSLTRDQLQHYRFILVMAGLTIFLAAVHLVPLPPAIWQALPGRDIVQDIEAAAGMTAGWRPLTLTPAAGANALFALTVPMAALLLAIQLDRDHLKKLVIPLLVIGALSGIMGIAQVAGSANGPLYLYRITNNGSAVGLFSNRNHQALFLSSLFPLLAYYASQPVKTEAGKRMQLAAAIAAVAMLVPLLLVTGSRQGLFLGLAGLASAFFIFQQPAVVGVRQRTHKRDFGIVVAGFAGVMLLSLVTVIASRAEAIQRLVDTDVSSESRPEAWALISQLGLDYAPWGSGSGSFVPVFQRVEPLDFLSPQYFNHAHNDFLEIWLTFGVPGSALLLVAVMAFLVGSREMLRAGKIAGSPAQLGRAGASIILLCAIGSMVDYPLRTPSLQCLFVVACCFMRNGILTPGNSSGSGLAGHPK